MKNILRIARIELSLLFYSPVAWIVLLVFIFQSGWSFISLLDRIERAQQIGQQIDNLTGFFFSSFSGVFPKVQEYLYLYIPLLTMGVISRETHSGSIKLLYSSPIRVFDIVVGKYLAMVGYCFILISVLLGIGLIATFTVENADFGYILSGIIGLYLLICAYSAIGIFMSSLTTYQVVAAISTLVVLAILNFIGGLWQGINFVRDITYFLSISGRAEESINGLLSTNDIFYFLIVIVLFVGLTLFKLQFERKTVSLSVKVTKYAGFIAVMLLLGYISSRPQFIGYKDMSATQSRTLTQSSREVIAKIDQPVVITTYVNILDENYYFGMPVFQNSDKKNFDMYFRYLPYMKMEYVYYWDHSENAQLYKENPGLNDEQLARKMAKMNEMDFSAFLRPEQIRKIINLQPERNRMIRTITYKGKSTFLRVYDDLFKQPGEKEISAALKRLLVQSPRVGFIQNHGERNIERSGDRDYQVSTKEISFRYALLNQGFDIDQVKLSDTALLKKTDILVIADPLQTYSEEEMKNLRSYIDRGGNLLLAAEPGSQTIVNPILAQLGLSLEEGMMVQKSQNFEPSFVLSGFAGKNWSQLVKNSVFLSRDSAFVTTPTVAPLKDLHNRGFEVLSVLVTQAANTWLTGSVATDRTKTLLDERRNEDKRSYPVALALRKKNKDREQRVFVIGDADFMSNSEIRRQNPSSLNFSFVTELFKWFSYDEFPIDTTRDKPEDNKLTLDSTDIEYIKWGLLGALPALLVAYVSWMLISRKRR